MNGYFDEVRRRHPYKDLVGKTVKGKRVIGTFNRSLPNDADIWGTPYVALDDGTEMTAEEFEKLIRPAEPV